MDCHRRAAAGRGSRAFRAPRHAPCGLPGHAGRAVGRRPRAAQRQDRHRGRGAAGGAGDGRARRHHRRARIRSGDPALHRRVDEGDRPEGRVRDAWIHRRARPLHRRRRSGAEPQALHREELGRHRPHGRGGGEDGASGRVDPRPRLASGKMVRGAVAERRRLPAARGAEQGRAEQSGLADARQRPRRLRQRDGDEGRRGHENDTRSGGRQDPEGRRRQPDRPVQRAGAVAGRRRAGARSRNTHAGAGRGRPPPGDRARRSRRAWPRG